jgi:hypothetical protein
MEKIQEERGRSNGSEIHKLFRRATIPSAIRIPANTASANQLRNRVCRFGGSTRKYADGSAAWEKSILPLPPRNENCRFVAAGESASATGPNCMLGLCISEILSVPQDFIRGRAQSNNNCVGFRAGCFVYRARKLTKASAAIVPVRTASASHRAIPWFFPRSWRM